MIETINAIDLDHGTSELWPTIRTFGEEREVLRTAAKSHRWEPEFVGDSQHPIVFDVGREAGGTIVNVSRGKPFGIVRIYGICTDDFAPSMFWKFLTGSREKYGVEPVPLLSEPLTQPWIGYFDLADKPVLTPEEAASVSLLLQKLVPFLALGGLSA